MATDESMQAKLIRTLVLQCKTAVDGISQLHSGASNSTGDSVIGFNWTLATEYGPWSLDENQPGVPTRESLESWSVINLERFLDDLKSGRTFVNVEQSSDDVEEVQPKQAYNKSLATEYVRPSRRGILVETRHERLQEKLIEKIEEALGKPLTVGDCFKKIENDMTTEKAWASIRPFNTSFQDRLRFRWYGTEDFWPPEDELSIWSLAAIEKCEEVYDRGDFTVKKKRARPSKAHHLDRNQIDNEEPSIMNDDDNENNYISEIGNIVPNVTIADQVATTADQDVENGQVHRASSESRKKRRTLATEKFHSFLHNLLHDEDVTIDNLRAENSSLKQELVELRKKYATTVENREANIKKAREDAEEEILEKMGQDHVAKLRIQLDLKKSQEIVDTARAKIAKLEREQTELKHELEDEQTNSKIRLNRANNRIQELEKEKRLANQQKDRETKAASPTKRPLKQGFTNTNSREKRLKVDDSNAQSVSDERNSARMGYKTPWIEEDFYSLD